MASLLSDDDKKSLTGALGDHFDTFKRNIVVYKEPKKIINSGPFDGVLAGYDDSSIENKITYVPVSGVYPAIITYKDEQDSEFLTELASNVARGEVKIKVEKDCRDFVLNGKTEYIELDGKSFNAVSEDKVQHYLGLQYYIFFLEQTK
jgi:hypothetical protein